MENPGFAPTSENDMYLNQTRGLYNGTDKPPRFVAHEELGQHSPEDMAKAVLLVGIGYLYMAPFVYHRGAGQVEKSLSHGLMHFACTCLDLATRLGSVDAAAVLCKITTDAGTKRIIEEGNTKFELQPAKNAVRQTVKSLRHKTPEPILSAYICTEFTESRLQRKTPAELLEVLEILSAAARHRINGDFRLVTDTPELMNQISIFLTKEEDVPKELLSKLLGIAPIEPPEAAMTKLLQHCLGTRSQAYPEAQLERMKEWREEIVLPWAENGGDPQLCMPLALRDEVFGSERWRKLMYMSTSAMSRNEVACWLLAIWTFRRDGVLDFAQWPDDNICDDPKTSVPAGPPCWER